MVLLGAIIGLGRSVLCCDTLDGAMLAAEAPAIFEAVDGCALVEADDMFNKLLGLTLLFVVVSKLSGCLG